MRRRAPYILIFFRLIAGLMLLPLTICHVRSEWLVTVLFAGLLSDVVDGIVACRLGISTLSLRRLDTRIDLVFYGCAVVAALIKTPIPTSDLLPWLVAYFVLFLTRNLVDYFRYRASPSYHMLSGKLWSVVVAVHLSILFSGLRVSVFLPIAFALYAINALEGIMASLWLDHPCKDIPSIWHVLTSKAAYKQIVP